jgi:hypothetical protein
VSSASELFSQTSQVWARYTEGPIRIDSTVPQIWLPEQACEVFETTFDLIWDDLLKLYLINGTTYERLAREQPEVHFELSDGENTNTYVFPWTAFTLVLAFPFVNTTTWYFPLKRASNPMQYVLGRAFLQETYITVDYERARFSISQAYPDGGSTNIVAISLSNSTSNATSNPTSSPTPTTPSTATPNNSQTLAPAAYVGIGVGAGIAALIAVGVLVAWRKRWGVFRSKKAPEQDQHLKAEMHGDDKKRVEAMERERFELETAEHSHELRGSEAPSVEVPGIHLVHELPESKHGTQRV